MDEHFVINLRIADTRYPIRIKRSDEELYRMAAAQIDYKLSQYKNYFKGNDPHSLQDSDYMVMTAVQAVAESEVKNKRAGFFEGEVKKLILEIDNYLRNSDF